MKVNRKAGTCNSWQEMDIESRQAVYLAERLVENKRVWWLEKNISEVVRWRYVTGVTFLIPK